MSASTIRWALRCASLAVAVSAATAAATAAEPGMSEFRHPDHKFTLSYPQDWKHAMFRGGPEFQVLSNGGKGPEDCNVNVAPVSGTDYLERTSRGRMLSTIRSVIADAEFTEWRRQTLGRRWGVYYIVTGSLPPHPYKQTTLGYQIVIGAKLFTLSCSAPAAAFERQKPLFEKILASLTF